MPPLLLSTWSFGVRAVEAARRSLEAGGGPLDAAVAGADAVERDPEVDSVGIGGLPDSSGRVSLDACVMTDPDRCGGVCAVREFACAAAIARRVMEVTPHILLAGAGADEFARSQGFAPACLLTDPARREWLRWRRDPASLTGDRYRGWIPPANVEERRGLREPSHDTVCVLARGACGSLAGACTTSGMAFKLPGRVGDSPIIGHGLYVDQQAGAASATGTGELISGVCGSFLAVEEMRRGQSPAEAVRTVLERIASRYRLRPEHQVALIAIAADGAWASGSLRPGFRHAVDDGGGVRLESPSLVLMPGDEPATAL